MTGHAVEGPYLEDLRVGDVINSAPSVTLTSGLAAAHQGIVGDRLRLALDAGLSARVTGSDQPLASPGLVWDVSIGQSTVLTHFVRANLFYRGLAFHCFPTIGDTLRTRTTVLGLRENRRREDRPPTGLAALQVTTVDQDGRTVLDFVRCAMLPVRPTTQPTGLIDDLDAIVPAVTAPDPDLMLSQWDRDAYRAGIGRPTAEYSVGDTWSLTAGDVVSSAPELARLTGNIARVHHDDFQGSRLVYGGHTIGLAMTQTLRALPELAGVLSWHGCDHTGPVHEGDTVTSMVSIDDVRRAAGGWQLLDLRVQSSARTAPDGEPAPVLDWRFTAIAP